MRFSAILLFTLVLSTAAGAHNLPSADDILVRAEIDSGKTPAQVIKELRGAGDYSSRCPDTAFHLDYGCEFKGEMAHWVGDGRATERMEAAIISCGAYPQTTMNFCVSKLSYKASSYLDDSFEAQLTATRVADEEKRERCKSGTELDCNGGMNHARFLAIAQDSWLNYVSNQCAYETEGNVGGSGHRSFYMICRLKLIAQRIESIGAPE